MKPTIMILLSLMICGCNQDTDVNKATKTSSSKESSKDFCNIEMESLLNLNTVIGIKSFTGDYSIGEVAKRNGLILEIYAQGELKKTLGSSEIIYDNPIRIGEAKFAVHIIDNAILQLGSGSSSGYNVSVGVDRDSGSGASNPVLINKDEFNCDKSSSCHTFPKFEKKKNKLPLFYIIGNSADGGSTLEGNPDELLERNPTAFIIVGSLKFE